MSPDQWTALATVVAAAIAVVGVIASVVVQRRTARETLAQAREAAAIAKESAATSKRVADLQERGLEQTREMQRELLEFQRQQAEREWLGNQLGQLNQALAHLLRAIYRHPPTKLDRIETRVLEEAAHGWDRKAAVWKDELNEAFTSAWGVCNAAQADELRRLRHDLMSSLEVVRGFRLRILKLQPNDARAASIRAEHHQALSWLQDHIDQATRTIRGWLH